MTDKEIREKGKNKSKLYFDSMADVSLYTERDFNIGFIAGAKWMQEQDKDKLLKFMNWLYKDEENLIPYGTKEIIVSDYLTELTPPKEREDK